MLLKACLNGARPPGSHPNLPFTPDAVAAAAVKAVAAGAGAVHVHIRNTAEEESLQAIDVATTLEAVRAASPATPVGISTGAWIVADPEERLALVREWTVMPDFASVNSHEEGAGDLARLLMDRGVGMEAGIWTPESAEQLVESGVAGGLLRVLIEPRGRTASEALDTTAGIEAVLDAHDIAAPRLLHGSRDTVWPLITKSAEWGYDTRIGLEDCLTLPDGRPALDNAALIEAALERIRAAGTM